MHAHPDPTRTAERAARPHRWAFPQWLVIVLAALSCLPALVARYPQMTDYAAHLARFRVMLDAGKSPFLAQFYTFDWAWSGNLGADLLIWPMAALFGLERGGWLIVLALPLLMGAAIMSVEWALRRRVGVSSVLAFVFIWSPSLLLGFLNFTLALALALFTFAGWVLLEGQRCWRVLIMVPASVLVWVCHVSGWGVLGLMVFGYEWSRDKSWRAFVAPWPLTLPFALMLATGGGGAGAALYGDHVAIYKRAIWERAMRDQHEWLDKASLAVIAIVLMGAALKRRLDPRLAWGAGLLLIGSLLMPRHIAGGDYADYRLIPVGLMVACLAADLRLPARAVWLVPAFYLLRLSITTASWHADSRETERLMMALDHVPAGARIASAVAVRRGVWGFNHFEHLGAWAVVRRDALVNANFAVPGLHMLRLKDGPPGFTDPSQRVFVRAGERVDLAAFAPSAHADWLWYGGDVPVSALPAGAVVVWRDGHALLARLANGPAGR